MNIRRHTVALLAVVCLASVTVLGQSPGGALSEDKLSGFTYRALGPYRAGSWIADIAVPDAPQKSHLYTFYVAVRYGGLWKTTNNGTTFEPVFDKHDVTGIGCVTVAPSNENIVWIGTGDASSVRVAYPGDGVYKSVDAGKTWQQMGLRDTQHIARIVVHPKNPDIVYVAAMGHLWSTNEERGVFKTMDGGKSWKKVLYLNDKTGAIDLVINRSQPDTLYAAMYEVQRRPWKLLETGVASGIHKTTDGGKTWTKLTGGFPATPQGRIGLDIYQKNPNILYAVTENFGKRPPTDDEAKRDKARNIEPQPRNIGGEVYRTEDGGKTWKKMNAATDDVSSKAGYSFNQNPRRSEQRQEDHHQLRLAAELGRRRQDLDRPQLELAEPLCEGVRRLPHDVDRSAELRPLDPRQRRRRARLLRRRPDVRPLREHPRRRVLQHHRGHGESLPHLRGDAGPRLVARADQRTGRPCGARGLADGGRQRRDVQPRGPDRQPVGLQHVPVGRPLPP